jgi:hypothetical protein
MEFHLQDIFRSFTYYVPGGVQETIWLILSPSFPLRDNLSRQQKNA